jgi:hypothetical protein
MSDGAVKRATGKAWDQWFAVLDKAGAQAMKHAEIARMLHDRLGVPEWWCQMVTVGYERARGMREKHQTTSGYSVSASRTINVPISDAFDAWMVPRPAPAGSPGGVHRPQVHPGTGRSHHLGRRRTSVEVMFYVKGPTVRQVTRSTARSRPRARRGALKKLWGVARRAPQGLEA